MNGQADREGGRHGSPWRVAAWGGAALLLLLPWIAMQFTDEVAWSAADFLIFGLMLAGVGVAFELAMRISDDSTYRIAVGVALAAAFLLVWLSIGVGIIGRDGDPANLLYFGVLVVGVGGALMARFRPRGMARALLAMALAQALVTGIALAAGLGHPWSGPMELVALNGAFIALFLGSAGLFRRAARPERRAG